MAIIADFLHSAIPFSLLYFTAGPEHSGLVFPEGHVCYLSSVCLPPPLYIRQQKNTWLFQHTSVDWLFWMRRNMVYEIIYRLLVGNFLAWLGDLD